MSEKDDNLMQKLFKGIEKSGLKVTFGIQPDQIERIEIERVNWNCGSEVDMIYSRHFWDKMGKEFSWCPFTLALYYFKHKVNSPH